MKYTWSELQYKVRAIKAAKDVVLSNQYGLIFLLNEKGQILLNLTDITELQQQETPAEMEHLVK
jgi:hypothetical protein